MFSVECPYDIGTFVKIKEDNSLTGTIVGYTTFGHRGMTVHISGFKESWYGEYLPDEIELMSDEEIAKLKENYNEF